MIKKFMPLSLKKSGIFCSSKSSYQCVCATSVDILSYGEMSHPPMFFSEGVNLCYKKLFLNENNKAV